MAAPKQTDPQFKLRMPPELKSRIEAAAVVNNRTMNAEMVERLEESFSFPAREHRYKSDVAKAHEETDKLYFEVEELENEIKGRNERQTGWLAEIRQLNIERATFYDLLVSKQAEIDKIQNTLGNYLAHAERLHRLEQQVQLLIDRLEKRQNERP